MSCCLALQVCLSSRAWCLAAMHLAPRPTACHLQGSHALQLIPLPSCRPARSHQPAIQRT